MIVLAGEFTKWFNINFEGEGRDELDFKQAKYDIWTSSVKLAQLIVEKYTQMKNNAKNTEDILSQTWWERVRFERLGNLIRQKFAAKESLKTDLRKIF